ncbi:MFS transporter [Kurthia sibirica]|uniref:MFS transporter n=1 Tax=Kurthia sibirica TaxID=202750 RepID=A0A2U3AL42_9BACL|nr:MFS transporter [Kurthia sibirica]PWI25253.1 MFS transporter [Kurthia sibirica]
MQKTLLKSYNFMFFGLLALFIPFLPVYMTAQGLNESEVGIIIGAGGFITIIAQPFFGMISDRFKTVRKVILLLILLTTIGGFALYQLSSFTMIIVLTLVVYAFLMPLDPLTESLSFTSSEVLKISYGSVRTYGALGFAIMSLIVGYTMDWFGMSSISYLFAILGTVGFIIVFFLRDVPTTVVPISKAGLKKLLFDKEMILFLILIFISSIPARMNDTFLGIHIGSLNGDTKLVGIAFFISAATEILIFALSFLWLKKGRELQLITIAIFFYAIRFLLSGIVESPYALIAVQVLQMVTFPIFYTAAIQYLYQIVPAEWRATGQTILALLFFGISGIISSALGGYIYTIFGGHIFYYMLSIISTIAFLYGVALVIRQHRKSLA